MVSVTCSAVLVFVASCSGGDDGAIDAGASGEPMPAVDLPTSTTDLTWTSIDDRPLVSRDLTTPAPWRERLWTRTRSSSAERAEAEGSRADHAPDQDGDQDGDQLVLTGARIVAASAMR